MATHSFVGNALSVKQVTTYSFTGTWIATDNIDVTINSKTVSVAAGSTIIATIVANVQAALAAQTDADFAAITWTVDGDDLVATAKTAGVAFDATITEDSTSGTITKTDDKVATGPNHWNNAGSWDSETVPASTDDVLIANSESEILYGLGQNAITLARLDIYASFLGKIGLPRFGQNVKSFKGSGRYLAIKSPIVNIGMGEGAGSTRLLLDLLDADSDVVINKTGIAPDGEYAVKLLGSGSGNTVTVHRGSVGIADEPGQTAVVDVLKVGQIVSPTDSKVLCGSGVTLTTLEASGGSTTLQCGATTINQRGGAVFLEGESDYTSLNVQEGTCQIKTGGDITNLVVHKGGIADFSKDQRPKTITNCNLFAGGVIKDPFGVVTFTNGITLKQCNLTDVVIETRDHMTVDLTAN